MRSWRFIDLFAGIGGTRLGLQLASKGEAQCVFTSEWDPFAQKTYAKNYHDKPEGDITKIDAASIPEHQILLAGFPCQPFSIAGVSKHNALGRRHGFQHATQGTLFYDVARIIDHHKPKAFLLENVKNLVSHDRKRTFRTILDVLEKELDYKVYHAVLDASVVVPQHRERVYIVGFREPVESFRFPDLPVTRPTLASILEPDPGPKYTLTEHLWAYLQGYAEKHRAKGNGFGFGLVDPADPNVVTRTLSARYYKDGSEILIHQGLDQPPRRLTPRECARLMGFPDSFEIPVSDTRAYMQFGNSVVVPMVEAVAREMARCLDEQAEPLPTTQMRMALREEQAEYAASLSAGAG